jgi:diguanylate cyclase (GGDEF)-like protein
MQGRERPHVKKPYALIAEFDPIRAANYVALVSQLGLEPNHVRDGEAARIALRTRGAPALVLCELALPRTDGFALLADLRQRCPPEQTPVVVVSAYLELRSRAWEQREALGISEVLSTASAQDAILGAIRRALSTSISREVAQATPAKPVAAPTLDRIQTAAFLGDDEAHAVLARSVAEGFDVPVVLLKHGTRAFTGTRSLEPLELDASQRSALERLITTSGRPEVVLDFLIDPSRMDNPLVKSGLVRSCVHAAITSANGEVLGSLSLFHTRRSAFSTEHLNGVTALARRMAGEMAMREFADSPSVEITIMRDEGASMPQLVALLDHIESGVVLFDESRRSVFANRAAAELLATAQEQLIGLSFQEFTQRNALLFDDPTEYLQTSGGLERGPFAVREELETQKPVRRVLRWVYKPVPFDVQTGALCLISDVTAEADLAAAREALVRTDLLTGLPNRAAAEEAMAREFARAGRDHVPLGLALVDLDHFASLNEVHGPQTADHLLKRTALMLEATLRGGDFVARWGADEFLLLLSGVDHEGSLIAAERVRKGAAELALGPITRTSVSIGITLVDVLKPPATALREASELLRAAQTAGGDRVVAAPTRVNGGPHPGATSKETA